MNDQLYDRRLFLKFVILASLLLWQLGHEFKFQTVAENSSVTQPLLPDGEVTALESVAYSLGYKGQDTFPNTLCNDTSSLKNLGISCNCSFNHNTRCHIDTISWSNEGLYGNLPEDMVNLTHLASLDLSANQIIGSIPIILGKMNQLYYLDLSANQIEGSIPATLGNMSQLNLLDLSNNHLSGTLPSSLGNLLKASDVVLDNNLLTGEIPPSLGNLSQLESLYLRTNQLNGSLPRELGNLALLEYLNLRNNLLSGPIPSSLGNLSKLRSLNLIENQLDGSLPQELGNLTSLGDLFLQSNDFSGPLPESFARLNLWSFSISGNSLSGPFPDYIKNWTEVDVLSLYGNNFQGKIPPEIFNLSSLETLEISDVETYPFEFPSSTKLTQIKTMVLRNCSIRGPIPPYIGNLASLEFLDLSFNNLTGEIPSSLKNINATYISFAENRLNGRIPAWISRAIAWTKIDLSYNEFSNADNVSKHSNLNLFSCCPLCNASSCTREMQGVDRLNLNCSSDGKPKYYNSLYINCGGEETEIDGNRYDQDNSTLPSGVGPGRNWAFSSSGSFLTKSSNSSDYIRNAKCRIPVADAILYSKARLAPVSLKYYGLCLLNGNYSVTLHFAEVVYTGDDSQQHSDLKKRIFDVYIQKNLVQRNFHINNSGNTEQEKVDRIEYHKAEVKNGTLEIHLYWAGNGSSGDPPDYNGPLLSAISVTPDIKIGPKVSRSAVAMITLSSITVALVLSLAFAWKMGWLEKEEVHDIKVGDDKTVTLKQLIVATCGFNKDVEIGKGGFGTVYRAELPDQSVVAVKKISTLSDEGIQKLNIGVYNLQNLRHENLVRLFDIHVGKDLCFLVYEYMENRSLADTLFDPDHKVKLNWEARYNICVGIAKGLQYLHEHPRLKMVHWGIKAANILLDAELKPKISDLGLASASVENDDEASHSLWIIKTEASTGYMAPEFPAIGKKSGYKYDVYSFGVLMLEIVCGTKNVGAGHKNKQDLVLLVDEVCVADSNGKLPNLVDESLSAYDTKQAMTILKLAMKCTHISPGVRPTMSQVVSVLADGKPLDEISTPAQKENDEKTEEDSLKELAKDADRSSVSE